MKKKWINVCQWLLGLFGISGSIASCDGSLMRLEYGQPNMQYSVKGKVVDSKSGQGVPGIAVSTDDYGGKADTTSVDGSFEMNGTAWPDSMLKVYLKDIDPEKDGSYRSSIDSIALQKIEKGDGKWYAGKYGASDAILKIEKEDE